MVLERADNIAFDEEGFLINRHDWTRTLADEMAAADGVELGEAHWEIIDFMRAHYEAYHHQPNARLFAQAIKKTLGSDKASSIYLYQLFPDGPLKYANKYAGLPIPPSCI